MRRVAFTMKLKPGFEHEYKRRHDEIWPELVKALEDAGVSDYSIFLDSESGLLFAVQSLKDHDTASLLPQKAIVQKWWTMMADIMDTNSDHSPIERPLTEVFHLD